MNNHQDVLKWITTKMLVRDPTWQAMVHGDCNIALTVSKMSKRDYWADQSDSKN